LLSSREDWAIGLSLPSHALQGRRSWTALGPVASARDSSLRSTLGSSSFGVFADVIVPFGVLPGGG